MLFDTILHTRAPCNHTPEDSLRAVPANFPSVNTTATSTTKDSFRPSFKLHRNGTVQCVLAPGFFHSALFCEIHPSGHMEQQLLPLHCWVAFRRRLIVLNMLPMFPECHGSQFSLSPSPHTLHQPRRLLPSSFLFFVLCMRKIGIR